MTHETHARIAALVAAGFLATVTGGIAYADTATSGNGSIAGGNQIGADIDVPINICGNSIAVLGIAGANCADGDAVIVDNPAPTPETDDSSTRGPHDGYEDSEEEETPAEEPPKETEELIEEAPEEPLGPEEPAEEAPEEEGDVRTEERAEPEEADETVSRADQELALTGADNTGLYGLVAAAVAAIAVGAGLVFAGLRRRTRA